MPKLRTENVLVCCCGVGSDRAAGVGVCLGMMAGPTGQPKREPYYTEGHPRHTGDTRGVAGHLTQSLAYWVSVPVLLQLLYHFRRASYTS